MNKISIFTIVMVLSYSCSGPVQNSNTSDSDQYGNSQDVGTLEFTPARKIIREQCAFCHTHVAWNGYQQADFIAAGFITADNPAASSIYYRNANAASGPGPRTMPAGGYPAMSAGDLSILITWINSL